MKPKPNPKRVYRCRTAEELAKDKAARAHFADRPGPDSGEFGAPIRQGQLWSLLEMATAIKKKREALGLSLPELARRTGIDHAALSRLENGRVANPTYRTLMRVADALGLELKLALVARPGARK